jgi:hypothetical protein
MVVLVGLRSGSESPGAQICGGALPSPLSPRGERSRLGPAFRRPIPPTRYQSKATSTGSASVNAAVRGQVADDLRWRAAQRRAADVDEHPTAPRGSGVARDHGVAEGQCHVVVIDPAPTADDVTAGSLGSRCRRRARPPGPVPVRPAWWVTRPDWTWSSWWTYTPAHGEGLADVDGLGDAGPHLYAGAGAGHLMTGQTRILTSRFGTRPLSRLARPHGGQWKRHVRLHWELVAAWVEVPGSSVPRPLPRHTICRLVEASGGGYQATSYPKRHITSPACRLHSSMSKSISACSSSGERSSASERAS